MNGFSGYKCSICESEYSSIEVVYTCPKCGGNLDVILDYDKIRKTWTPDTIINTEEQSLWRYSELLPVEDPGFEKTPFHAVGFTPVYQLERLRKSLKLEKFWLKDEGRNPTASYKDRASAVVIARAFEIGAETLVTASTGNAGAALAGMAAATGMKAVIFAPKTAPPAKVAQLLIYGAEVILVDANYDAAFDLTVEAAQEFGWYCRNTGMNPFTLEGKKTGAFEIWEQLLQSQNENDKPLCIFVSVGDGNIISGLHKGFKELVTLGWLHTVPRLFGVQSTLSAAVAHAFDAGVERITPVSATTIADSISVDLPRDGVRAVRAASQTNGSYIKVSDEEIISAIADLGTLGVFSEPAGSTAFAGLKEALRTGLVSNQDPVLVVNTGNGLKDVRAATMAAPKAAIIEPTMNALTKYLNNKVKG